MTKKDWGASKIDIRQKLQALKVPITADVKRKLGDLTFGECDAFATELAHASKAKEATTLLTDHWQDCTLKSEVRGRDGKTRTWATRCKEEAEHNR